MRNKCQVQLYLPKDKQGKIIGEERKILDRRAEYFKEMLKNELEDGHEEEEVINQHAAHPKTEPPTSEEAEETIAQMKNNQAPAKSSW
jgi:hypothetical protein